MHINTAAYKLTQVEANLDNRDIQTRAHDGKLLKVTWPKDPLYRRSLEYRLPTAWNDLLVETRNLDNMAFQAWNKKFYLDKCTKK